MNPKKHTIFTISALIMFAATVTYAEDIAPGEYKTGSIAESQEVIYTFWGQRPRAVTILVAEISGEMYFSPEVELRAPDHSIVDSNSGSNSATIEAHVTQCGIWYIIVRDHDGTHTGQYGLSLIMYPGPNVTDPNDPDGGPVAPGQTKTGIIREGDLDAFTFSADANDTVTILIGEISGEMYFSPEVELRAPDHSIVDSNSGSSSGTIEAQPLTQTGTYFIIVRDRDGYHTGEYGLSLIKYPGPNKTDPDGGPVAPGETKVGTIGVGDLDAFTFWGNPGDTVGIRMAETSGEMYFYPRVELREPNGNILESNSGSNLAEIETQLNQPTTYFIIAQDRDGYHTGEYNLHLTRLYDIGTPAIASLSADPNSVVEGEPFTLTAEGASDPNGYIVQVDFYCDINRNRYLDLDGLDLFLGSDPCDANGWDWTGSVGCFPLVGENRYFARAMDNSGAWSDAEDCIGTVTPGYKVDFDGDGKVDFLDFAIFAAAWRSEPNDPHWNPDCDVSQPPDNVIDFLDLDSFTERWLEGLEPCVSQL